MNSIQYTIRNIPEPVDKVLRQKARTQGKSFNQTVIDTLEQATVKPKKIGHDLDWFIGKGSLGKEFDEAQAWLESLPKDLDS
ncbi:MAG: FitA-like ribbon-helix-helix domain-containing protein [Candidatus Saccharimonadales bacterium]